MRFRKSGRVKPERINLSDINPGLAFAKTPSHWLLRLPENSCSDCDSDTIVREGLPGNLPPPIEGEKDKFNVPLCSARAHEILGVIDTLDLPQEPFEQVATPISGPGLLEIINSAHGYGQPESQPAYPADPSYLVQLPEPLSMEMPEEDELNQFYPSMYRLP